MKVAIRVDSSICIGSGHLMRCLTLASELIECGHEVAFICRKIQGNFNNLIKELSFLLFELSPIDIDQIKFTYLEWLSENWSDEIPELTLILESYKPDLLVVDHYALDEKWERKLTPFTKKLFVIDDLANRKHHCDYLLDQTVARTADAYSKLVSSKTCLLLGAEYALLRPEFKKWRDTSLGQRVETKVEKILVTLGGVDEKNYTGRVLNVLKQFISVVDSHISVTIILGESAPNVALVEAKAKALSCSVQVLRNVTNMAEIMSSSDLCIGAAGSTSWERCCLGLPSFILVIADNQRFIAERLDEKNAAIFIDEPIEKKLLEQLIKLDNLKMKKLSANSASLIDGLGASRIIEKLLLN